MLLVRSKILGLTHTWGKGEHKGMSPRRCVHWGPRQRHTWVVCADLGVGWGTSLFKSKEQWVKQVTLILDIEPSSWSLQRNTSLFRTLLFLPWKGTTGFLYPSAQFFRCQGHYMSFWITFKVICSEVDGVRVCHTEWSKSEREKQIQYANTYVWNLREKKKRSWRT